jgi:hypothetical protein
MDNLPTVLDLANKLGALGTWVLFGWMLYTGRIIFKRELDKEKEERAKAEQRLLDTIPVLRHAGETIDRSVGLAQSAVETVKRANGQAESSRAGGPQAGSP